MSSVVLEESNETQIEREMIRGTLEMKDVRCGIERRVRGRYRERKREDNVSQCAGNWLQCTSARKKARRRMTVKKQRVVRRMRGRREDGEWRRSVYMTPRAEGACNWL